jgi:hypothetical protein
MRHLFALIALLLATVAGAATPALPYDEQADAHAAVQRAWPRPRPPMCRCC